MRQLIYAPGDRHFENSIHVNILVAHDVFLLSSLINDFNIKIYYCIPGRDHPDISAYVEKQVSLEFVYPTQKERFEDLFSDSLLLTDRSKYVLKYAAMTNRKCFVYNRREELGSNPLLRDLALFCKTYAELKSHLAHGDSFDIPSKYWSGCIEGSQSLIGH